MFKNHLLKTIKKGSINDLISAQTINVYDKAGQLIGFIRKKDKWTTNATSLIYHVYYDISELKPLLDKYGNTHTHMIFDGDTIRFTNRKPRLKALTYELDVDIIIPSNIDNSTYTVNEKCHLLIEESITTLEFHLDLEELSNQAYQLLPESHQSYLKLKNYAFVEDDTENGNTQNSNKKLNVIVTNIETYRRTIEFKSDDYILPNISIDTPINIEIDNDGYHITAGNVSHKILPLLQNEHTQALETSKIVNVDESDDIEKPIIIYLEFNEDLYDPKTLELYKQIILDLNDIGYNITDTDMHTIIKKQQLKTEETIESEL